MSEVKKKKKVRKWPFIVLFIVGFLIMIYPVISDFFYRIEATEEIGSFNKGISQLDKDEIYRRIELARGYNTALDTSRLADPYTENEKKGIAEYARMLEVEEKIGHVEIPAIKQDIPIYTGSSESVLQRGAGHLEGTSLPIGGPGTHAVITAHRGLPRAKLFRNLNQLKEGDVFYIHNIETVLAYQVDQILTVEPFDFSPILVQPGKDYVTLLTCTPYMINSHRLLVRGHRINYVPPVEESDFHVLGFDLYYRDVLMFLVPTMFVLLAVLIYNMRRSKEAERRLEDREKE